jgi:hypothetical protein
MWLDDWKKQWPIHFLYLMTIFTWQSAIVSCVADKPVSTVSSVPVYSVFCSAQPSPFAEKVEHIQRNQENTVA